MIEPRPYQAAIIADCRNAIAAGNRRLCIASPTGSGKTVVAALIMAGAIEKRRRALFLAHRRELIRQTSVKLFELGVDHGTLLPGFPMRLGEPVQVASVATLHGRAVRNSKIDLPPADVIYVDECHHVAALTYQQIIDAYPEAAVIGLTATPCRGDGRGLGTVFDKLILGPSVAELIAGGFLVGTRVYAPSAPDLEGVRVARGDYVEKELAPRMAPLTGDIVGHWHRLANHRPTVVFASSVGHAVRLRDEFRRSGVVAEELDGATPADERDRMLEQLADGVIDVVCNYGVLTEGVDIPAVSAIVLARPTKHHGVFLQMVGRGLRPAPGKIDCLVLDHAGATFEHGLVEDPVTWSLQSDRHVELPAQWARKERRAPALTECPECRSIRLEGQPCPACGWRPQPKAIHVDVAEGELSFVDRDRRLVTIAHRDEFERRRFQAMLAWIASERGYAPGWVSHKYREKFGGWPTRRHVEPIAPTPEVRSWVRSRQIAFAKSGGAR